jgi:predicted AlkP superfamily phosphohydrolase/phosphomutase
MDLATVRPTSPDPVWATVATGMFPSKNGVQSPAEYSVRGDNRTFALLPDHCFSHVLVHLGLVQAEPNSSATLRARPLWSILGDAGISSGIVRWPLTSPAQPLVGFVLTDRFHELVGSLRELDDSSGYPEDVLPVARRAYAEAILPDGGAMPVANRTASTTPEASAGQRDRFYSLAMRELEATWPVRFSALRFQALDTVGHYNLRYTQPRDVTENEDDRRRRLQVVDRHYGDIDDEIGRQIGGLVPGDLLLVVSGFGMESPSAIKRLLARVLRDPMSGTHERAPDGFLLAYGTSVEPGRHQRGSIVDVTPTVLYFLGLPVARDMDGYARPDLFRSSFTSNRPIAFVPTYRTY